MDRDHINKYLESWGKTGTLMDGYDEAIVGYIDVPPATDKTIDNEWVQIIYSYPKCIQVLIDRDGMSEEEAVEYFDYNTLRSLEYLTTPIPIIMEEF